MNTRSPFNIHSKSDCQSLIDRIVETLADHQPNMLSHIQSHPRPFIRDDYHIFERLTWAILSSQSGYAKVSKHFPAIKQILFNYNLNALANLSDKDVNTLYLQQVQRLSIPSRISMETKFQWVRDDAEVFLKIQCKYDHVWQYLSSSVSPASFNSSLGCFIHPADDALIKSFSKGPFKLMGVGLPICCEFFNTIGIDEFKPDVHTKRFLNRLGIAASQKNEDIRNLGITIASTLGQSRKFVDSNIWIFCADGEGEICTEQNPKCYLCRLKNGDPRICWWEPK